MGNGPLEVITRGNIHETIQNRMQMIRNHYKVDVEDMVSKYQGEIRNIDEYRGRQLLELIQNADDASVSNKPRKVWIQYWDHKLIIANNGERFSEDGVISLLYSNLSPKARQENKIGKKGLGFRSILSWAKSIYIKSDELSIQFSKEIAQSFLKEIMEEEPSVKDKVEKYKFTELPIATLHAPKWIDDIDDQYTEYDTYIVIECNENIEDEIHQQIQSLDEETMLFLNNLDELVIDSDICCQSFKRHIISPTRIEVDRVEKGLITTKAWSINTRTGIYEDKEFELKVAFTDTLDDKKNVLYSYFRTEVAFPFPAIIHGTFDLTGNRNQLIENSTNAYLLEELLELLLDTAILITKKTNKVSYDALKFLMFEKHFDPKLENYFKFTEKLLEKLKSCKIFPTIADNYIDFGDEPVYYTNAYAQILPSQSFTQLLLQCDDAKVEQFLVSLELFIYEYDELVKDINAEHEQFSIEQRVDLLYYLIQDYGDEIKASNVKPLLLLDTNGQIIEEGTDIFLAAEQDVFENIPNFISLKFLHREMTRLFRERIGQTQARAIADFLEPVHVTEYNFESVMRAMMKSIRTFTQVKGDKQIYIDVFIPWLYESFKQNSAAFERLPSNIHVLLPSRNGRLLVANKLYFGKDYGQRLTEELLQNIEGTQFVAYLAPAKNDEILFKDFLSKLGVRSFPELKVQPLVGKDKAAYGQYVLNTMQPLKVGDQVFATREDLLKNVSTANTVNVLSSELFDAILKTVPFEYILAWLLQDEMLRKSLENEMEHANSSLMYLVPKGKLNSRQIMYYQMPSYILWKLRQTPWIATKDARREKPSRCCLARNLSSEMSKIIGVPNINLGHPIFKQYKITRETIDYCLLKVGVPRDFSEVDTVSIYSMLQAIPDIYPDGKGVRAFYRHLVQNVQVASIDKTNAAYDSFLKKGKLLATHQGKKDYYSVNEVSYLDNRTLSKHILDQFPILDLEKRSGEQKVLKLFGAKPLKNITFQLNQNPILHSVQRPFTEDLQKFLPFAYCYRIDKDAEFTSRNVLKKLDIQLCSKIDASFSINEQSSQLHLQPYEYIIVNGVHYVQLSLDIHESLIALKEDFYFCDLIAEIFTGIFKVEDDRNSYRELYSKSISMRQSMIRNDFDDVQLELLRRAEQELQIALNERYDFWQTLMDVLELQQLPIQDNKLKVAVVDALSNVPKIDQLYEEILYTALSESRGAESLCSLFQALSIDFDDFNAQAYQKIDIKTHFIKKIDRIKEHYTSAYYSHLYNNLIKMPLQEQKLFEVRKRGYQSKIFQIENSCNFNAEEAFFKQLDLDKETLLESSSVTLNDLYYTNEKKFIMHLETTGMSVEKKAFQQFCEKDENKSLIYFAQFKMLATSYSLQSSMVSSQAAQLTVNTEYKDVFASLENASVSVIVAETEKPSLQGRRKGIFNGGSGSRQSDSEKENIGFYGESIVFYYLQKYGKNVKWVSENAKKANVNADGREGFGYDLKYIEPDGTVKYVEVKASTGNALQFYITPNEVNFAEKHKEDFELYFVRNIFSKNPEIVSLGNIFNYEENESFRYNPRFIVENKDFRIHAKLKE